MVGGKNVKFKRFQKFQESKRIASKKACCITLLRDFLTRCKSLENEFLNDIIYTSRDISSRGIFESTIRYKKKKNKESNIPQFHFRQLYE